MQMAVPPPHVPACLQSRVGRASRDEVLLPEGEVEAAGPQTPNHRARQVACVACDRGCQPVAALHVTCCKWHLPSHENACKAKPAGALLRATRPGSSIKACTLAKNGRAPIDRMCHLHVKPCRAVCVWCVWRVSRDVVLRVKPCRVCVVRVARVTRRSAAGR